MRITSQLTTPIITLKLKTKVTTQNKEVPPPLRTPTAKTTLRTTTRTRRRTTTPLVQRLSPHTQLPHIAIPTPPTPTTTLGHNKTRQLAPTHIHKAPLTPTHAITTQQHIEGPSMPKPKLGPQPTSKPRAQGLITPLIPMPTMPLGMRVLKLPPFRQGSTKATRKTHAAYDRQLSTQAAITIKLPLLLTTRPLQTTECIPNTPTTKTLTTPIPRRTTLKLPRNTPLARQIKSLIPATLPIPAPIIVRIIPRPYGRLATRPARLVPLRPQRIALRKEFPTHRLRATTRVGMAFDFTSS